MWKSLWPEQTKVESRLVHRAPPASQSFYWSAVSSDWLRRFEPSITQKQPPVKHNIRLKLCEVWQRLQTNISPFDLFISFYSDKWRSNLREAACCKSDWLTSVSRTHVTAQSSSCRQMLDSMSAKKSELEDRLDDMLSRIAMETQEIKELEQQLTDGAETTDQSQSPSHTGALGLAESEFRRSYKLEFLLSSSSSSSSSLSSSSYRSDFG